MILAATLAALTATAVPASDESPASRPDVTVTPPPAPPEAPPGTYWPVPVGHAIGVLAGMRLSLSVLWPAAYDPLPVSRSASRFERAYTAPPEYNGRRMLLESDNDPWPINVIGHGLFGSEIYGRVRQCGGGRLASFAFATGTSVVWEYGVESFNKPPSALDLVATPLFGAAIGEARYQTQRWLRSRRPSTLRRFLEIVVDPFGELERRVMGTRC